MSSDSAPDMTDGSRSDSPAASGRRADGAGKSRAPVSVQLVTHGVGKDRLHNALIDNTNPDDVRYSVITLLGGDGPLLDDMATRGVEVRSLGMSNRSLEAVPLALVRLRRMLATTRPDLIHSLLFYPSLTAELARALWGGAPPSLIVRHHNALLHLSGRRLHVRLDRWMACRATHVVAVSHAVARTLSDAEGIPAEHVTVIHNGLDWERTVRVDAEGAARWRRRFGDRRLLVAAGRIAPEKDYPTLLRTLARVLPAYPDALLVIAGKGPHDLRVQLEQLARSLGVARSVEFVGWVPGVYDLMAAADVFVQSAIDEACPQTIIEARGLAVPLATTTAGAVREVVGEDHETIAAGDDEHLAQRVVSLLAGPEVAHVRAAAVAPSIRERFSARTMAEAYVSLYTRIAEQPPRGVTRDGSA